MKTISAFIVASVLICSFAAGVHGETTTEGSDGSLITLQGNTITLEGSGAKIGASTVTITSGGTYTICGTLNNGQVIVDCPDTEKVTLVLSGAHISCATSAPIYVASADKAVITLADGTSNSVTDGSSYVFPDAASDEPNAAIFSKDDLTINGGGALSVTGNYNDGITSKDDLKITGGSVTVNAKNDGVRGRDSVVVREGTLTITASGDGIQSNNDEDAEEGYVSIESGTISIITGADGIQAESTLAISGGSITITSGGGAGNGNTATPRDNQGRSTITVESDTGSAKGLKAGAALEVSGGSITINSADDAIHSNGSITIDGGTMTLASGDDAIHADSSIETNGGYIDITNCYEGLESEIITLNEGTIHLTSRDDGINAVSKTAVAVTARQPGQQPFEASGNCALGIHGGYLVVNAGGDGFDINGPVTMTGGTVIINGPTDNGNGAIDYLGSFTTSGGTLLAVGSSGMAQAPGTSSSQNSVMVTYSSLQQAGTLVHIETSDGDNVLTFRPAKAYQSVVFSSPSLKRSTEYVVYSGGSTSGTSSDGLYFGGIYTPGTEVARFTISGTVTMIGSSTAQGPGNLPGNRNQPMPGNTANNSTGTRDTAVPGSWGTAMPGNISGTMNGMISNARRSTVPGASGPMNGMIPGSWGTMVPGNASNPRDGVVPGTWATRVPGMPGTANGMESIPGDTFTYRVYSPVPRITPDMGTTSFPTTHSGTFSSSFSTSTSGGVTYSRPSGIRV